MIIVNPEFHRNLWLKFSPFRLIAVPLLIGCIVAIFASYDDDWAKTIQSPILQIYFLIVIVWGNYEAANAIQSEMKGNTWDFQKMSSTGSWELAIGKLFGPTSYVWYFGLTLLLVYAAANFFALSPHMAALPEGSPGLMPPSAATDIYERPIIITIVYMILSGVMGHATAVFFSMERMRQNKSSLVVPFLSGFFVSYVVKSVSTGTPGKNLSNIMHEVSWHDHSFNTELFTIGSLLFFLVWIVLGVERRIREELQFKNAPIAWPLFTLGMAIYFSGFVPALRGYDTNALTSQGTISIQLFIAFLISMILTYCTIFAHSSDYARYRRFFSFLKARNYSRAWENTPMWLPSVAIILPLFFFLNIISDKTIIDTDKISILGITLSMIILTIRDGCAIHAILLGDRMKHNKFILLFYYLMAYMILPLLLSSILNGVYKGNIGSYAYHDLQKNMLVMFYPLGIGSHFWQILPVTIEMLASILWLKYSLRKLAPKA